MVQQSQPRGDSYTGHADHEAELARQSAALEEQRAFLHAMLENLTDAVIACDGEGELTVFNPAAERLHGLPVEPLAPQRWAERYELRNPDGSLMRMEDLPLYRALRGEAVAGTRMLVAPHGRPVRTVLATGRQLRDRDGRVLGAMVSLRDVSEAVAAQERAERYTRALVATIDAQRAVTAAVHDRGEVLRVVADRAVAAFPVADGAVVELLHGDDVLEYTATAGTLRPHVGVRLAVAGSLSGVAMASRSTVRCDDVETDPRVNREACRRVGVESMCVAPLYAAERPIGVLKVASGRPRAFDDADAHQLELLAASLSAALRHAEDYAHNATLLHERTEALAALEVSERRFRLSFDNSPVGMLLIDLRPGSVGRFLQANPAMSEITGYRREELTAMTYPALTHPDDLAETERSIDRLVSGGVETVTVERRYRHATGRTIWVDVRVGAIRDTCGRPLYLVAQVQDVTRRRAAQARLERQARLLQLIPTPVIAHDLDGTIRGWNGGAEATYGYGADAVAGQRVHELLATDAAAASREEITAALRRDGQWTGQLTHHGADGRRITVLSRQVLEHGLAGAAGTGDPDDLGGRSETVLEVNTDITALRDREAELAAFAGVVAHDLKNPLTGIIGFAEMAAELLHDAVPGGSGVQTAARYVTRVKENAQHMNQLIDDLLAFATARDAPLRPGWADLATIVTHVVTVRTGHLAAPDRPDIVTGDLPTVWADAGMLRQVLDNLIGNAVKYTRPGSRAQVTVAADHAGPAVRISVADRGIGIPADQRRQVLSQFHRAHTGQGYAGTGLGLAICQRVIERHGGAIEISENPGGGTVVTVTLPHPAAPP
ncbi:PAS domain S-box protein [Dactylosporangium sp. NPDC000555]|uniref:PAS domain S-box protein n=1 Tax=Dactylosporangium sp. NPDC000555 TaxID=3154260 RepID=UPI003321B3B7